MFRRIAYWISTGLLIAWLLAGGAFDLSRAPGALAILHTLGYPAYLCFILGSAKLLAIAALLYSGSRTLREWAYAGIVFDGLGAFFSHLAIKDAFAATIAPAVFLVFAAASYLLRPPQFRLPAATKLTAAADRESRLA